MGDPPSSILIYQATKDSELTEEPGDELEAEVFEELELTPEYEQPFDA